MPNNPKVHYIPANPPKREKRVGIYCRVSTNSMEQIQSLTIQVSHLTRLTATVPQWLLSDVYMDIATSKTGSSRKEFNRMLEDCKSHKLEIVITKDVSRFGRDTVEVLDAFNQLRTLGVRVIFEGNSLDTANTSSDLMVAVIESIAQAENESRSENIKWGIKQRAAEGTSKLYDRKCYGYKHNENGHLVIDEETAKNVKLIYDLYLSGQSVVGIIKELAKRKILSPKGKENWNKRSIEWILSNEKYTGNVELLKSSKSEVHYLASGSHPAIISKEVFEMVQMEKGRRSNVVRDENGVVKRKDSKYSSKK
ncbi:recombinase family protein [Porcipelethomonas sp.]|uniref:recombinase family protein n=1 Tax=Porcipelethomonas sp. TaxID=2981675 RepID=UPI00307A3FD5